MARSTVTALLHNQILDLWNDGDLSIVDRKYAENVVDHMPVPGQPGGRSALKRVVTTFREAIPDLSITLHGTIACADMGVDFWTLSGTHAGALFGQAATGRAVSFSGIDMVRVSDHRIAELWHVEEMLQFADQIGQGNTAFGAPVAKTSCAVEIASDYTPGSEARMPRAEGLTRIEQRNLGIARNHIENIWAHGDIKAAYRLYAPGVVDHNPAPGQRAGIDGIVDVLGWLREAVPDLRMSIRDYVVEGDLAADRWIMRGTHTGAPLMGIPAIGKTFEINGMDVIRVRHDGLITDVWHVEEFARLKAQISP